MMTMPLSQAAEVLNARQRGADVTFRGVSTDTRTLAQGNLFVALRGPSFDGHDYLAQARRRGAVAATVSEPRDADLPLLEVGDTRIALGELAAHWRTHFAIPVVGLTGSNGKTTVKEMIAAILARCGEALVTRGNLNNDIGVPLTLLGLGAQHRYAVVEMGANHPGEIGYLTRLVQPTVGLVNNAGPAHLEGFCSLEGVAKAKGELFEGLGSDAVCVINADDHYAGLWRAMAGSRSVMSFALEQRAEVQAQWRGDLQGSDVELHTPAGATSLRLSLPGRHNVMNALAAAAATLALEIPLPDIVAGLAAVRPVHGRWESLPGVNGVQLIDDTYNANPASLQAALQLLVGADVEPWLVLGDMGELGQEGRRLHRQMGEEAKKNGVQRLFALGELAQRAAEAFGDGAEVFADVDALTRRLAQMARPGVLMLVKGSRSMRMERVVAALRSSAAAAEPGGA
jgi:UDP-N-acetylmuramoyl-tripeptide--D-alanyl-D-alanine ligase